MPTQSYRDLYVWQRAVELVVEVYQSTKTFPEIERFGLTSQLQRSVTSIPANIAEGYGRFGEREYVRFLFIARGSLMETETHLIIASRLGYLSSQSFDTLWNYSLEIERMLNKLIRTVQNNIEK